MGNILFPEDSGTVKDGVKEQASGATKAVYTLVDASGGGLLVKYTREARKTGDYELLDERIKESVKPLAYNEGKGKWVHIRELVETRTGKKQPISDEHEDAAAPPPPPPPLDDNIHFVHGCPYKKIGWRLDETGALGESALHVCLLNASSIHADLAKRLIRNFPALINDIYTSDEFYGENVLHMAIVNEDPAMVKFLLDNGADYHQRACGNFFTADDLKAKRKDSFKHEWFDTPVETNYEGYTYWGEYPLGFAACLGQEECVRLLVAKGADPNLQDHNGNTVLHSLVIHDNKMTERTELFGKQVYTHPLDMFDILVELGAKIHVINRQGLCPLTLAAKLGRRSLYDHILELDREVFWIYGNVSCAAYPLEHIDTISATGKINTNSAAYMVVSGDDPNHLDMIDGIISQLLHEKWRTFAKHRFLRRFFGFLVYFVFFVIAFYLRPGTDTSGVVTTVNQTNPDGTKYQQNITVKDPCYLQKLDSDTAKARLLFEIITLIGSLIYLFLSMREIHNLGYRLYLPTLLSSPTKGLFMLSNILVLLLVPGRAACAYTYEDVVSVAAILCTAPYFLFFCRGFKIVGPFVVMIYKMIRTDLIRFFLIYLIFVVGFSQSLYVLFRNVPRTSPFKHPFSAVMGLFAISLGQIADITDGFPENYSSTLPQVIFLVYMIMVTLLLINMLIAMMGNTYNVVNDAPNEWLRQWAKIILVVEQTVTQENRVSQQLEYSQAMADQRRAIVIRWHQTEKEQEELKAAREEEKDHQRQLLQKKRDAQKKAKKKNLMNVTRISMATALKP